MRRSSIILVLSGLAVTSFFAGRLVSQGKDDDKNPMAAFQAYMTPGKEHQMLAKRAGKWEYKAKMYMAPGTPPTETKGKVERRVVMGGRYLVDDTSGEPMPGFGDQPFSGMGLTGFDNFKKKFVSTWVDNMGTGIMLFEGTASADGKTITYNGEEPDLMGTSGKFRKVKSVEKMVSDDKVTFEMFSPGEDGKEAKTFEIEYTRKK